MYFPWFDADERRWGERVALYPVYEKGERYRSRGSRRGLCRLSMPCGRCGRAWNGGVAVGSVSLWFRSSLTGLIEAEPGLSVLQSRLCDLLRPPCAGLEQAVQLGGVGE